MATAKTNAGTNFETEDAPVKIVLTIPKSTLNKLNKRRKELGLTHTQDVVRVILALYFERS